MTETARANKQFTQHWAEAVYRTHAALLYDVEAALFRNDALTKQEIRAVYDLAGTLDVGVGPTIVDLACGPGRHGQRLARDGHDVVGVDFSETFLKIAAAAGDEHSPAGRRPRFVCGDLRKLQFQDQVFDTALLLGNSFGFYSDEQNVDTLAEAHRVLRDGAMFCLEITNKDRYLAQLEHFEEELIDSRRWGRLKSQWWKQWDAVGRRVRTRERHSSVGSREILYEGTYEVRLYDVSEIEALLTRVGFGAISTLTLAPDRETLKSGLGETFGSMTELLFVAATK